MGHGETGAGAIRVGSVDAGEMRTGRVAADAMHVKLMGRARRQAGVVTRAQLLELGYSYKQIAALVRRGELASIAGALVVTALVASRNDAMARALQLRLGPRCVVTGAVAAHILGARGDWPERLGVAMPAAYMPRHVHVSVPGVSILRGRMDGTVLSRGGVRLADRTTALLDCIELADEANRLPVVDHFMQMNWLRPDQLEARVGARCSSRRGRRSSPALRTARAAARCGTQSAAERLLAQALRRAGLHQGRTHGWLANHLVEVPGSGGAPGRRCKLDFAWPSARLAVEVDGRAYHSDAASFERDRDRRMALHVAGWTVVEVTWKGITENEATVIDNIQMLLGQLRVRSR